MFDPTVFDNLKVAFENQLYDLDNVDEEITIVSRHDRMEMADMSREFRLGLTLRENAEVTAEICLEASLRDLADEILEAPDTNPGCRLRLFFYMTVESPDTECPVIESILTKIWTPPTRPEQTLQYVYDKQQKHYQNTVEVRFDRKINEDQMEDLPNLIDHILDSLEALTVE
ncbi:hypothetical protein SFC66_05040 [Terribacillus saccharophilus]|uniref:hypothetical protein n=1 Tax=Terribacillus saccharophilus TaxID=361277 RepID=UPI00398197B1